MLPVAAALLAAARAVLPNSFKYSSATHCCLVKKESYSAASDGADYIMLYQRHDGSVDSVVCRVLPEVGQQWQQR
jgi:hypothetical protein